MPYASSVRIIINCQCWQKQVKSSLGPVAFDKKQPMPAFCEKQGKKQDKKQGKKQAIRLEAVKQEKLLFAKAAFPAFANTVSRVSGRDSRCNYSFGYSYRSSQNTVLELFRHSISQASDKLKNREH